MRKVTSTAGSNTRPIAARYPPGGRWLGRGHLTARPDLRTRASRLQDDLAAGVPLLELAVRGPDLGQRVDAGDRDLQLALVDQPGQLGQHAGAGRGRAALGLDPVLLLRGEVGDG